MSTQPLAILVPTSPAAVSTPSGPVNGAVGQPDHVVYNSAAVVVTSGASLVPQQVMYTAAAPQAPQQMADKVPNIVQGHMRSQSMTPSPTTIATEGMAAPLEVQRGRQRLLNEQHRPRNPGRPRKLNGEKGLGKVFYYLEQMKQEVTDADKTIKSLQSDMKFMVRSPLR